MHLSLSLFFLNFLTKFFWGGKLFYFLCVKKSRIENLYFYFKDFIDFLYP